MRLGTNLEYAGDPRQAAARAIALEQAGVDVVWVSEAYGFDSPTLLGYLAAQTARVQLGSSILSIYSRTPTLIAQTAAGLDAVSGGRALLGLGASGPQVVEGWHGQAFDRPLARTREIVEICRAAWRRDVIRHEGIFTIPKVEGVRVPPRPLKMLTHPVRDSIPIFLAALGDRNVALAAEIADGWIPYFFAPDHAKAAWGDALAEGAQRRDAALAPLDVVASAPLAVTDDPSALDLARPKMALYIGGMGAKGRNLYHDVAVRYGFGAAADAVQDAYLDGRKSDAEALLPQELLRACSLIGPRGSIRERVEAYRDAGVGVLNVVPIGPGGLDDVRYVRECIG